MNGSLGWFVGSKFDAAVELPRMLTRFEERYGRPAGAVRVAPEAEGDWKAVVERAGLSLVVDRRSCPRYAYVEAGDELDVGTPVPLDG